MNEQKKNALIEAGVELDEAIHRFMGMEDMYEKFLLRYTEDNCLEDMKKALEDRDVESIFKSAHYMKGLAANLELTPVKEQAHIVTEKTRGRESLTDEEFLELEELIEELSDRDKTMTEVIKQ